MDNFPAFERKTIIRLGEFVSRKGGEFADQGDTNTAIARLELRFKSAPAVALRLVRGTGGAENHRSSRRCNHTQLDVPADVARAGRSKGACAPGRLDTAQREHPRRQSTRSGLRRSSHLNTAAASGIVSQWHFGGRLGAKSRPTARDIHAPLERCLHRWLPPGFVYFRSSR